MPYMTEEEADALDEELTRALSTNKNPAQIIGEWSRQTHETHVRRI